ncbi:MAG: hypothetical protein APF84_00720 [Gracilibacter sp. BRH_c7a]|nr:MAG: hypothetical protein APF84_00720 [Gracilibacter sp. BRH_c7a]
MTEQISSEYELTKTQTKEKAKEKMFDAILEYAAACHVENIIEENKLAEEVLEFNPSPEFEYRMKKLIAEHDRSEKIKHIKNRTLKFLPKVAIFFFVLIGSLTLVIASVDALRIRAINLIVDIKDQYTGFTLEDSSDKTHQINYQLPPDWNGYYPNYVPEGFTVIGAEDRTVLSNIYFEDSQGRTIRFSQYSSTNTDLRIDTENADVQQILIHDIEALLVEKQGLVGIVWENEYLFYITGEADKAELIKMAESVEKNI